MSDQSTETPDDEPALHGLTLTRFGEVMAHLRHFAPEVSAEVIARLGLQGDAWQAARDTWVDELASEAAREEHALARRFGEAFARARARLQAEQPPLSGLGTLPGEAPAESAIEEVVAPPEVPQPSPAYAKPSAASFPSREVSPWAADIAGTFAGVAPTGPVLPFDENAPPSLPERDPNEVPANLRSLVNLGGTLDAPAHQPGSVLPFDQSRGEPPPCGLTLEQYASLCVELEVEDDAVEVLRRYRITSDQRVQLDTYWRKRMAAMPSTWADWERAYKAYKAWYASARNSGVGQQ